MSAQTPPAWLPLIIWACFVLRGLFYSSVLPVWEGYDEWCHFAFVQYLQTHEGLPAVSSSHISREIAESLKLVPLPWLMKERRPPHVTHDAYWKLSSEERRRRETELAALPADWQKEESPDLLYEAQQPPLYYWLSLIPLETASARPLPERVMLLRFLGVLLASCVIPLTIKTARLVFRDDRLTLGAAVLVALMPELMIDVCHVGNDSLAVPAFALLLWLSLIFAGRPESRKISLFLGLILGLGLLAKAYFLTAVLAIGLIMLWKLRAPQWNRRRVFLNGLLVLGTAAVVAGWWYGRNKFMTDSWSGLMRTPGAPVLSLMDLFGRVPEVDWYSAIDSTFFSHIWFGAWSFLQVRSWMYHLFRYAVFSAVLGLGVLALRRRRRPAQSGPEGEYVFFLGLFYGSFWLGLLYHILLTYSVTGSSSSAGWYLCALSGAEAILATAGLRALAGSKASRWVVPGGAVAFGLLDLYTMHFLLIPYYTGMIGHKAGGAVESFHLGRLQSIGIRSILERLHENDPAYLNTTVTGILWILFLAATFVLIWAAFYLTSRPRRTAGD